MDEAHEDPWSAVAHVWAELWGGFADPVRLAIVERTGIRTGSRVLDVGCGSGEFLDLLDRTGATTAGIDPAPAMIELARTRVPAADLRLGDAESLPWPDGSFDVVTAVNALQFADDPTAALADMARVTAPGGLVAVANWAEGARNDLHRVEVAVAAAHEEDLPPDGDVRMPGGLEALLTAGGLAVVTSGLVAVPWEVDGDDQLVRGILMGEDSEGLASGASTVVDAARTFRTASGGYRLTNAFRFAIGRTPPRA